MSVRKKKEQIRGGLTKANRNHLYAVGHYLPSETAERIGLEVPCKVYAQDPFVAEAEEAFEKPQVRHVRWEPGLADGPTSSRLAVVDYDADHDLLVPPAKWDQKSFCFVTPDDKPVQGGLKTATRPDNPWFRQVNAWATVQSVLEYFENPRILGRAIPWGFAGNRLTIVPHAGYQANAYYNRAARALQLYYYGDTKQPSYTCLSHDIVAHETGHAILDGVRPLYLEHVSRDTAAFHEAVADLTALLVAFRHNHAEAHDSEATTIDPDEMAPWLSAIAAEFGKVTRDRPYLRNARNDVKLGDLTPDTGHHEASQVISGAMFDVLTRVAAQHLTPRRQAKRRNPATVRQALWWAADRIGRMVFQPLDLLPPADVSFLDYARAVLRNVELTDPDDPWDYREMARRVFHERGFCPNDYATCDADDCVLTPPSPPRPDVYHDVDRLSRSRTDAYRFLHDNRRTFHIPANRDFEVVDLYVARKYREAAERMPHHVVVEYVWREEVPLEGSDFGALSGRTTTLPCGGTVVLDAGGNVLSWSHKPGRDEQAGRLRRDGLRERLARLAARGEVALVDGTADAALRGRTTPVLARTVDGTLRMETAPHLCHPTDDEEEAEPWTTSF